MKFKVLIILLVFLYACKNESNFRSNEVYAEISIVPSKTIYEKKDKAIKISLRLINNSQNNICIEFMGFMPLKLLRKRILIDQEYSDVITFTKPYKFRTNKNDFYDTTTRGIVDIENIPPYISKQLEMTDLDENEKAGLWDLIHNQLTLRLYLKSGEVSNTIAYINLTDLRLGDYLIEFDYSREIEIEKYSKDLRMIKLNNISIPIKEEYKVWEEEIPANVVEFTVDGE